ncbi:MAG: DUF969 domain-containing protein [Aerococcus sp.]|nr:DUF969 domain-containing protein [Aerococcus sp.]
MAYIKLIGILIIVIGFAFKLDTIAVVIIAGLATAFVSGLSVMDFLTLIGEAFVKQRLVTIFIVTLPMIGLAERYGMKQQAIRLVDKVKNPSAGKFNMLYLVFREIAGMTSIRIGGHPQFTRPLIEPMTQAAVIASYGKSDDYAEEQVKGHVSAVENIGNFFAQQTFAGSAGVLLVAGALTELGFKVTNVQVALASFPVAIFSLVIGWIWNWRFDQRLKAHFMKKEG